MDLKHKLYDVPKISNIQEMVLLNSKKYAGKIALEDLNDTPFKRLTFDGLLETVLRFGTGLQKLGLKERSHIAVISENRVQWSITYLTAMTFNYVIVPIDKNLTSNEILNIIYESESEAIVFSKGFSNLMNEEAAAIKRLKMKINMDILQNEGDVISMTALINSSTPIDINSLPKINNEEMAEIIFTSGSLGRAKGVMLTQKNLAVNLVSMTSMMFIFPEDKFLSVLPIHHTYECTCGMLCPLYSGASVHFARSLKTIVDDLQVVKATVLLGVPLLFDKMFKRISKSIKEDKVKSKIVPPLVTVTGFLQKLGLKEIKAKVFKELHARFGGHVRIFIAGGAAPDPEVAKGLRDFGFTFVQGYGLTETAPIVALNRLMAFKDDAAGLPLPGVDIKIVDPDQDGVGEVFVKGGNVMLGYYKNEALTKEAFVDGYFRTGDLGYIDSDGFLHIRGRKKNVIIASNGKNVFPEEIEDIINRNPLILESFVYGEEDAKHTEIIAVQVVLNAETLIEYSEKNGIKIDKDMMEKIVAEIVKETNKHLPVYKQIKKFYLREKEFEKTTTQKIKRYLVK
ncbi:MAG: AMP-binding protein [Ignavibacteria bacterium]|nr:AMP-binding protein [Ignavibacteria bacterium]